MNTHHRPEREGKYKIGDKVYCQGEDDKKKVLRKIIGITPSLGDLYRFNSKDGEIAYFEDEITPLAEDTPLEEIPHTKGFRSKEEIMELVESVEEDTAPEEWVKEFDKRFCFETTDDGKRYYRALFTNRDQTKEIKAFIRTLLKARDDRAVEIVNSMSLDTDEWIDSRVSDAFAKTKKEAMTAIRANRSERSSE